MNTKKKTIEVIEFPVTVTIRHISEGVCGSWSQCMEKLAIEQALRAIDPKGGDHRVRIDSGIIKFNLGGWKYEAPTPRIAKRSLIRFDSEQKARERAERKGETFVSKVKPHSYTVEARRVRKIEPMTRARQEQINAARRRRENEGRPDREYKLRQRIIGLSTI
jgi:hypothetical protein